MYPSNHDPNHQQPLQPTPQRLAQPHPLNRNFRFPPPPDQQRSVSLPQPQQRQQQQQAFSVLGHAPRQTAQLNPEASSFAFRPQFEVSSPLDNGLGRLRRYHDAPSGLGVDFVGDGSPRVGSARTSTISPRKAALAHSLSFANLDQAQQWFGHAASPSISREPPPGVIRTHRPSPSMSPLPPRPASGNGSPSTRYREDRSALGLNRPYQTIPGHEQPPHLAIPQTSGPTQPPPQMIRAWTLDSLSRASLSPLSQSPSSLPLTLSPLPQNRQGQGQLYPSSPGVSPSGSIVSAPFDSRDRQEDGRRVVSLSPNYLSRRDDPDRRYRGFRGREGGPPKAVLGGPGGKTFDEMLAERGGTSPAPGTPDEVRDESTTRMNTPIRKTSAPAELKWKGNPITVKLPPERYSPPDSPPKPLPPTEEGTEPVEVIPQLPRKEAYPWPPHNIRLSPTGTPLPMSPHQPGGDTRRPSIASTADLEENREGMWKGREVLVSFPTEGCWERLRPPTPPSPEMEPEEEVSTVLQAPPSDQGDLSDARSIDMVEDAVPALSPEMADESMDEEKLENTPWDQWPESPEKEPAPPIAPHKIRIDPLSIDSKSDANLEKNSTLALVPHSSLPPRPITRDDPPIYSAKAASTSSDHGSSAHERTLSGNRLGNTDFFKQSLEGVLASPTDSVVRRKERDGSGSFSSITQRLGPDAGPGKSGAVNQQRDVEEAEFVDVPLDKDEVPRSKMRAWTPSPSRSPERSPSPREPVTLQPHSSVSHDNAAKDDEAELSSSPSTATGQQEEMKLPARDEPPSAPPQRGQTASAEEPRAAPLHSKMRAWDLSPEPSRPVSPNVSQDAVITAAGDGDRIDLGRKLRAWSPSPPPLSEQESTTREVRGVSDTPKVARRPTPEPEIKQGNSRMRAWAPSPSRTPILLAESSGEVEPNEIEAKVKVREWDLVKMKVQDKKSEKRARSDEDKDDRAASSENRNPTIPKQPVSPEEGGQEVTESHKAKRSTSKDTNSRETLAPATNVSETKLNYLTLDDLRRKVIESRGKRATVAQREPEVKLGQSSPTTPPVEDAPTQELQPQSEPVDNSDTVDPSLPDAKRLRPTAEPWQPASQPIVSPSKRLRPTAEPWRPPRSLAMKPKPSFDAIGPTPRQTRISAAPVQLPADAVAAPAFVPRSAPFNWPAPAWNMRPPMAPSAAPFVPRSTSFNWPPPVLLLNPRDLTTSNEPSSEKTLRPNAPAFAPPKSSQSSGNDPGFTFTLPRVPLDVRERAGSVTSNGEPKLRPTAAAFVPPQKLTASAVDPFLPFGVDADLGRGNEISPSNHNSAAVPATVARAHLNSSATAFAPAPAGAQSRSSVISIDVSGTQTHSSAESEDAESTLHASSHNKLRVASTSSSVHGLSSLDVDTSGHQSGAGDAVSDQTSISEQLIRVSSTDEPILSSAEIRFEQHRTPERRGALEVGGLHGRGRADTVAFGPPEAFSRAGSPSSTSDGNNDRATESLALAAVPAPGQSDAELENGEDRSGTESFESLFVDPIDSGGAGVVQDPTVMAWRERASPLPTPDAGITSDSERSTASLSCTKSDERLPRSSRAPAFRQEENSYRSKDLPSLPHATAVIPLDEVTIHTSHPFQLQYTPARPVVGDLPDAPVSAHTHSHGLSVEGDLDSTAIPETHTARSSLSRPLPPIHQATPDKSGMNPSAKPFMFTSPARQEDTPPQSTGETYSSAAYLTADGSPLVPHRTLEKREPIRPYRSLPDIPTWTEPAAAQPTTATTSEGNGVDGDSSDSTDDVELLLYPKVDITAHLHDGFERSAAPSPDATLGQEQPLVQPSHALEPSSGGEDEEETVRDEVKFREWTFPLAVDVEESGHTSRPSIIRRHTMPDRPADDLEPTALQAGMGVASTFASRVGELRAYLKSEEVDEGQKDGSRRTSVEFPLREEKKRLELVNPELELGTDAVQTPEPLSKVDGARDGGSSVPSGKLDEVLTLLRRQGEKAVRDDLETLKWDVVEAVQGAVSQVQESVANPQILERVAAILEEHSHLLTALHDAVNQPTPPRSPQRADDDTANQSRSRELFAAILTGQHAILEKFDEVASARLSGTDELDQAIEALRSAQLAAEARSTTATQQEEVIACLRAELADSRISTSESRAEADVLNQRLRDTRQDRDDVRAELEGFKSRLEESRVRQRRMEDEIDGVVARALAAELERDALAKAVSEGREEEDRLRVEMQEWKEELDKEKEASRAALAGKELDIVSIQAALQAQIQVNTLREQEFERQRERESVMQTERQAFESEPPASGSALAELSQATVAFHEEVVNRFTKLDEHMLESMSSRVKEYESVLDKNRILQGEVDGLRGRLEASADRFAKLQLSTSAVSSKFEQTQASLEAQLAAERERREESERKLESMGREMERTRVECMGLSVVAAEREAVGRMNEVRFQALTQENVYWRQFALEHDRRRFKAYLSTQPFKGFGSVTRAEGKGHTEEVKAAQTTRQQSASDISQEGSSAVTSILEDDTVPVPGHADVGSLVDGGRVDEDSKIGWVDCGDGLIKKEDEDGGVWYDEA